MLRKGDPPIVQANTPLGLEVMLHSNSHDPDGIWPGEEGPKALRVDLSFEQWTRTKGEAFSFLGEGQDLLTGSVREEAQNGGQNSDLKSEEPPGAEIRQTHDHRVIISP